MFTLYRHLVRSARFISVTYRFFSSRIYCRGLYVRVFTYKTTIRRYRDFRIFVFFIAEVLVKYKVRVYHRRVIYTIYRVM